MASRVRSVQMSAAAAYRGPGAVDLRESGIDLFNAGTGTLLEHIPCPQTNRSADNLQIHQYCEVRQPRDPESISHDCMFLAFSAGRRYFYEKRQDPRLTAYSSGSIFTDRIGPVSQNRLWALTTSSLRPAPGSARTVGTHRSTLGQCSARRPGWF